MTCWRVGMQLINKWGISLLSTNGGYLWRLENCTRMIPIKGTDEEQTHLFLSNSIKVIKSLASLQFLIHDRMKLSC